jgi:putative endonuclease
MSSGRLTQATIRALDLLTRKILPPDPAPQHQRTGRRGEEDAYFYMRRQGYIMVARNFRSPNRRGEIDLIAWHKNVLCFIEVKTRTTRNVKPAHAAVDDDKRRNLISVARDYLRHEPPSCQWRFDIVSVYYELQSTQRSLNCFRTPFLRLKEKTGFGPVERTQYCPNLEKIPSLAAGSLFRPTAPSVPPISRAK